MTVRFWKFFSPLLYLSLLINSCKNQPDNMPSDLKGQGNLLFLADSHGAATYTLGYKIFEQLRKSGKFNATDYWGVCGFSFQSFQRGGQNLCGGFVHAGDGQAQPQLVSAPKGTVPKFSELRGKNTHLVLLLSTNNVVNLNQLGLNSVWIISPHFIGRRQNEENYQKQFGFMNQSISPSKLIKPDFSGCEFSKDGIHLEKCQDMSGLSAKIAAEIIAKF